MPNEEPADPVGARKWEGAVEIPTDQIEPDAMNANVMSPQAFQALCESVQQEGFDEPIQVAPLVDENTAQEKKLPDGRPRYVIIGGEHRYRAMKLTGSATIPCVVKPVMDVVTRRMAAVKRNLVRGDLDRLKFAHLVRDLEARRVFQAAELAKGMGFESEQHFRKFFKEKKAEAAKVQALIEESRKEIQLSDNLAHVLSELLGRFGCTMSEGWVFFAHKNRLHLMMQMEPALYKAVQVLVAWTRRDQKLLQEALDSAIRNELKRWGVDPDQFQLGEGDLKDDAALPSDRLEDAGAADAGEDDSVPPEPTHEMSDDDAAASQAPAIGEEEE